MRFMFFYVFVFYVISCISFIICEPFTMLAAGATVLAASYYMRDMFLGFYKNACDMSYSNFKRDNLEDSIRKKLFGQHLVELTVIPALDGFLKDKNPRKPLVISFHGPTGCGKNYVSKMIAESIYKEGFQSPYVHLYVANLHFPDKDNVEIYKNRMRRDIKRYTEKCPRNIFIFDEIEKVPAGVLNALKSFLDYHDSIDGVDYRKNIFIFLSNTGSQSIVNVALQFFSEGRMRSEMTLKDIEPLIEKGSFNEKGGFHRSELLSRSLVDLLVPFLPLEKIHIKDCIRAELRNRKELVNERYVDKIAETLHYYPEDLNLYSTSGCKRIEQKINVMLY